MAIVPSSFTASGSSARPGCGSGGSGDEPREEEERVPEGLKTRPTRTYVCSWIIGAGEAEDALPRLLDGPAEAVAAGALPSPPRAHTASVNKACKSVITADAGVGFR
jgi:hypothetical protein